MRIRLIQAIINTYMGVVRRAHNGHPVSVTESIWCLRAQRVITRSAKLGGAL